MIHVEERQVALEDVAGRMVDVASGFVLDYGGGCDVAELEVAEGADKGGDKDSEDDAEEPHPGGAAVAVFEIWVVTGLVHDVLPFFSVKFGWNEE